MAAACCLLERRSRTRVLEHELENNYDNMREGAGATVDEYTRFSTTGWAQGEICADVAQNHFDGLVKVLTAYGLGRETLHGYFGDDWLAKAERRGMKWPGVTDVFNQLCKRSEVSKCEVSRVVSGDSFLLWRYGWQGSELPWKQADKIQKNFAKLMLESPNPTKRGRPGGNIFDDDIDAAGDALNVADDKGSSKHKSRV